MPSLSEGLKLLLTAALTLGSVIRAFIAVSFLS